MAQSLRERREDVSASERVTAAIRVTDSNGRQLTIFETWKPAGWLGWVAEQQFRLSTGEAVEQLAENVFVILTTNETLIRVTQASILSESPTRDRTRAA